MVVSRALKRNARGQFIPEPTIYDVRFDRRLEARWAFVLDTLGVGYRYDSASVNPGEGSMFLLPRFGDLYLFVRLALPVSEDIRRAKRWVSDGIAQEVVIISGKPSRTSYTGFSWWRNSDGDLGADLGVRWQECLWCSSICLAPDGAPCPHCEERDVLSNSTTRLYNAYALARRLRLVSPGTEDHPRRSRV